MKKFLAILIAMSLPYQALHAAETSTTGLVVAIVGQRVTVVDASTGAQVTFSVATAATLAPGDQIRVTHVPAGDALRAVAVTKLSK
jgi:hypothetical protein